MWINHGEMGDLHYRGPVSRIFAVEHQDRVWLGSVAPKKFFSQGFLVIPIDGTFDMAALVLILETAVNDDYIVIPIVIFPLDQIH